MSKCHDCEPRDPHPKCDDCGEEMIPPSRIDDVPSYAGWVLLFVGIAVAIPFLGWLYFGGVV